MSYVIRFNQATGIANITLTGTTTSDKMQEVLRELSEGGEFMAKKRLWDLRNATGTLTSSDAERLARTALSQDANGTGMVAIVASEDVVYGISRVFGVHRESKLVRVEVFRDIEEARRWLQEDQPDTAD